MLRKAAAAAALVPWSLLFLAAGPIVPAALGSVLIAGSPVIGLLSAGAFLVRRSRARKA